jgi:hypothetical protein
MSMIQLPAKGIGALFMAWCALAGVARAADPIPAEVRFVAANSAAPPTTQMFTIATSTDLVVTLTDQNFPAPLVSGGVLVTQGGTVAGSATFVAPSGSGVAPPAVASIPAAMGNYTLYVFGVPGSGGVGTFSACVAPKTSPSNCIQSASIAGIITVPTATDPTLANTVTPLTVTADDMYTFTFGDLSFPVALNTPPSLALFQGSQPVIPPGQSTPGITSGSALHLIPGSYQLFAIAKADPTVMAGLYSVNIAGTLGGAPLLSATFPVGLSVAAPTAASLLLSSPQSLTLTVTDYGFPAPLASASALLTAGSTVVGTANGTGGPQTYTAPAGQIRLWTYGNPTSGAGTYSVDVSAGASDLYTFAQGVSSGNTYAYAYVPGSPLAAGAYQATAADLQFPSQLASLSFAVAQKGVILQKSVPVTPPGATVNFNAAAGSVVILASAQPPASGSVSGNGLFDVNLQSTGASANLVFDQTQSVSSTPALFDSQALTIGVSASFDATLTDLKVPAAFDTLALIVSRGSAVLGKIYGGGSGGNTFSFMASAGTYQLTFVATPSAMQNFGAYATSVVFSPPVVTLTASATSVAVGGTVTLNWSASNAASCTASGGTFTGSQPTSTTSLAVVVSVTTNYMLSCTGAGGTSSKTVTVTATPAKASGGGGGGAVDPVWLIVGSGLLMARFRRRQR